MKVFAETLERSKKAIFDRLYGQRHFTLQVLATHPDWQRRGAGTMLCRWGITVSLFTGTTISVFASPMGQALYSRLGFCLMSRVELAVEGDEESVVVSAMGYEANFNELVPWRKRKQRAKGLSIGLW
jgi:ribosomal protein S18 acetylase RimI-like enzyme